MNKRELCKRRLDLIGRLRAYALKIDDMRMLKHYAACAIREYNLYCTGKGRYS